jgi:hypothetical protein
LTFVLDYKYLRGFLRALRIYLFTFIQKATKKYRITGDPMVRKEM